MLEDDLGRTPLGISYVVEGRRAMTHVFPELFASVPGAGRGRLPRLLAGRAHGPRRQSTSIAALRSSSLRRECTIQPASEHSFLARQMGVALVEGRDLVCKDGVDSHMRTTAGEERVDVIYRRVDDEFLESVAVQPCFPAWLPWAAQFGPGRQRNPRQCGRQRGGRRQSPLPAGPRPRPLLSGRGNGSW